MMQIGFVGLGKMGGFMVEKLALDGHTPVGFDLSPDTRALINAKNIKTVDSIDKLIDSLESPKIIWLMIPAGKPVDNAVDELKSKLSPGDIVIDGGNSFYKDSLRHYNILKEAGINFLDVGTSGGIWGLEIGYCVMIGGDKNIYEHCEPIFRSLAPEKGYIYIGSSGSGHFVKMIHNGIEYGLMQAYAEGFEIMHASDYNVDLPAVADLWGKGSVVRSWLLELLHNALKDDKHLSSIKGFVEDSGEGRWTVAEAIEKSIPAPVITSSLMARFRSRQEESYGAKILAALRHQFGGHSLKNVKKD
jgi:6-phosphogluconate dehydrogenase